ncbi:bifunctional (p)ppGpp synthetase/guanosine-3',5'-bis(diphosphate) 3'-pyrophosphohydrolase [Parvularcula sp. IMCC14364]|uniref:RelA/SpoT family protein n=1 Tax=Parvularcula sp. IMCC14364 TaxID=3067902 RepID=UPI002741C5DC|nr:bifunctional (p)ppGpp synthetase/guanosine-3',5'-bis(diphosphate) 3'-pyrophosphohydrolase [Parvularcula sp. IMCC14364]
MGADNIGTKGTDGAQAPVSNSAQTKRASAAEASAGAEKAVPQQNDNDRHAAASQETGADLIGTSEKTPHPETGSANGPAGDAQAQAADQTAEKVEPTNAHPVGFIRQYELIERIKIYDPKCNEDLINRAYVYSMKAHGGQTRKNGDPYFTHPISVAAILTELKADPETIITALLHDTVEDTDATVEEIRDLFGPSVAHLVDGVTKLSQFEMSSEATKEAENFRKFVLAMSRDVRVLLVKLADRLHNMRTLHYIPKEAKRHRIALETMQIYVPLAGRIGVQKFREELEDLSFKYMNPEGYQTIQSNLERLGNYNVRAVVHLGQTLRNSLQAESIKSEVYSREKRPFSIWRKMQRKNQGFDELADIYAFRILVETEEDCYRALGVIHRNFTMIPGEFDDYISVPKPNNYRSIHTAVLAPVDNTQIKQRVEVQIRTKEMHESAERGIAAHWRYKDISAQPETDNAGMIEITNAGSYDPYDWARNAVEMLQQGDSADEFLAHAKLELFQDQVFCFTPKGRVIALPAGATPIDFAYALHTEVGESCVGARINGATRPLRTPLKNGDVVRILRSENAPIPQNWESLVVTGRARSSIRRRIKELKRKEQVKLGRRILESEFSAHGFVMTDSSIEPVLARLGFQKVKDVYQAVGSLKVSPAEVREVVYPGTNAGSDGDDTLRKVTTRQKLREAISVEGLTRGVSVRLAPCCSPLPGERIIGLPTEDDMVAIHRIDCDSVATTSITEDEWLDMRWRDNLEGGFVAPISINVNNRIGALAHVSSIMAHYEVDIVDIKLVNREVEFNEIQMDILIRDVRHLGNVLTGLRASEHVIGADRRYESQDRKTGTWEI